MKLEGQYSLEAIQTYLKRLKLTRLAANIDDVLKTAKDNKMTPTETLAYALSVEVKNRETRRIAIGMSIAHFPRVCTLEAFDFDCQTSIDPAQIRDLARLEWVEAKRNLFFLGPPGVGTTHLAIALGRLAVENNYSTTFVSASTLMKQLKEANDEGKLEAKLLQYAKPKLLIIDEIGYLPVEPQTAYMFFQLVSARYERASTVLTSNRSVGEWGTVFGDAVAATAILDRLLHHSEVITIRGDSYRLLEMRRQGLLNKERAGEESGS